MKLFQTTARFLVAATLLLSLGACDRDDDLFVRKEYSRVDVPLTGAQKVVALIVVACSLMKF